MHLQVLFGEDFEDRQVYVNIHKSSLYRIACRYSVLPCTNMIHWSISHIDPETMTLSSVSGTKIATFKAQDYEQMYHMLKPIITMETPFSIPSNSKSKDILKKQVKELAKFRMTPNKIYKTKTLRKAYQYLIIFSCRLYGQESTETFPQIWVIVLDQLAREGKSCNWSDMLAHQLKEYVTRA